MPGVDEVRIAGDRIETLLDELGSANGNGSARATGEAIARVFVELYGAGLARVMEVVTDSGPPAADVLRRLVDDGFIAGLLILHDLHPLSTEERVRAALDNVRPFLGTHAGGVELLGVDPTGVVQLKLEGTCHGCPSSLVTVKQSIERAIAKAAPEVIRVDVDGMVEEQDKTTLLQIQSHPPPGPCPVPEEAVS